MQKNEIIAPSLLLCEIDLNDTDEKFSEKTEGHIENSIWYTEYLDRLTLVDEFSNERFAYKIFSITDENTYGYLWEYWDSIVKAVFSADCDITKLKENLLSPDFVFKPEKMEDFASWVYTSFYGCLSYFHAKNKRDTQTYYSLHNELIGTMRISRF